LKHWVAFWTTSTGKMESRSLRFKAVRRVHVLLQLQMYIILFGIPGEEQNVDPASYCTILENHVICLSSPTFVL
jgi:hypothetical protein